MKYTMLTFLVFLLSISCSLLPVKSVATVTFTPQQIPLSNAEIANPFHGSYKWQSEAVNPSEWPVVDTYVRLAWRDLEPTQNSYDFSKIETLLAEAKAFGGKAGIRILAACSTGCYGILVPDYLVTLM